MGVISGVSALSEKQSAGPSKRARAPLSLCVSLCVSSGFPCIKMAGSTIEPLVVRSLNHLRFNG